MANDFTKGPWTGKGADGMWFGDHGWCADNDEEALTMFVPIHADGKVVALVVREDWHDAKMEADARLISAAPDLLAFAEAYRLDLQAQGIRESDMDKAAMELLRMADAAIAKATGDTDAQD